MNVSKNIIREIAIQNGVEYAALMAFIEVETGGRGFDPATGKLLIQFEPAWFKRNAPYAPSGKWSVNKVEVQSKEWKAFNDAYAKSANAAMMSTSIGLGQILGLHYKRLGYDSAGAMWDAAKESEYQQVLQLVSFINTDKNLLAALQTRNWDKVASLYNGAGYKALAQKLGREPYDQLMAKAYTDENIRG